MVEAFQKRRCSHVRRKGAHDRFDVNKAKLGEKSRFVLINLHRWIEWVVHMTVTIRPTIAAKDKIY